MVMPADRWDDAVEGMELLREGSSEAAVAELERVLAADPDNDHALLFLGHAWFEREDFPRALKAYLRVLDLVPKHRGAMIGAGHTTRRMGKLDHAVKLGEHALGGSPKDPDALYLLGAALFARGDGQAAIPYLQRLLEARPEAEVAIEARGMLQVLGGEVLPLEDEEAS